MAELITGCGGVFLEDCRSRSERLRRALAERVAEKRLEYLRKRFACSKSDDVARTSWESYVTDSLGFLRGDQIVTRRDSSDDLHSSSSMTMARPAATFVRYSGYLISEDLSNLSLPELQARKKELKQMLKAYDTTFFRRHGRMPAKAEKEPIRYLYERYHTLKDMCAP